MEKTRTNKFMLSMSLGFVRQMISLVLAFISRTVFIKILGAEYLGITGLFGNILSFLSLTELGIGSAIVYYLYKPLANQDRERIKTLMNFYGKCYKLIGITIFCLGLLLMPLLPYLVNLEQSIPENLYLIYLLYLINTMVSYMFFAYKKALLTADQKLYRIEIINIVFLILSTAVDIITLAAFKKYVLYLTMKIVMTVLNNLAVARRVEREYPYLSGKNTAYMDRNEIKQIWKDTGSIFIFKVGAIILFASDNIIISICLGTVFVGYYGNYSLITTSVSNFYNVIIQSFTAGVGNVNAVETKERQLQLFKKINFINFVLTNIICVSLCQLITPFMKLWLEKEDRGYILSEKIVILLVLVVFLDNSVRIYNIFRETKGLFSQGKYIQLISGVMNILLSVAFAKKLGLAGIFLGTVASKLFISTLPYICIISREAFGVAYYKTILYYLEYFSVTVLSAFVTKIISGFMSGNKYLVFLMQCGLCVVVPAVIISLIYRGTEEYRDMKIRIFKVFH